MTSKKSTPSGAHSSTSARTKNHADKPTQPKGEEKDSASDKLTPERLRAFLAHPDVKESVKDRVKKLVGQLYEAGEWDTLPKEPEMYMLEFQQTFINDHMARGTAQPDEREIYQKLAAVINRHEPKDARLVRRLAQMMRDPKTPRETFERVAFILCDLSSETQIGDTHPDIFETVARVLVREARPVAAVKVGDSDKARREWLKKNERGRRALSGRPWMLKKYLAELEAIAGEKGGK